MDYPHYVGESKIVVSLFKHIYARWEWNFFIRLPILIKTAQPEDLYSMSMSLIEEKKRKTITEIPSLA